MNASGKHITAEKVLVFPFDLMSHYLRCIELAKHYPRAEILFASSAKYDHFVRKAGYRTFKVERFDAEKVMACAAKFDFSWLNKTDIERIFLSMVEAIRALKPQRVIGDTSPALKMAAEFTGVPYTALMNGYMSRYYAKQRALPRIHPAHGHLSRLPHKLGKTIIRYAEYISFRLVHRPFRQLRRKYRLKPVFSYLHEMEGNENLLCDDAWLFPQKSLPQNYKVIGPLLYDAGQRDEALLNGLPRGKSIILVCMGSSGSWEALRFLSSPLYAGFTILTAGDANHVIHGNHVIAQAFISLNDVLPKCALLVCHGGNGTIYQGLRHKVPILCLTSHFEQEWNLQRLEELGLGTGINSSPKAIIDSRLGLS